MDEKSVYMVTENSPRSLPGDPGKRMNTEDNYRTETSYA